jgi:hypothetical protein
MKAYGGVDVYMHIFLTSALAEGEWSASRPGRFNPGERVPGSHWVGGLVDPRAGLDDKKKRKFLTVYGFELRPLGRPVALLTTLSRFTLQSEMFYLRYRFSNRFQNNYEDGGSRTVLDQL